jgi:predicted Ser/Thr protein kinase
LRELFDAASELDPPAREAYLRDACGDSKDLLREVQALLTLDRTGNPFLEQGVGDWPELLPEGAQVGPYRVVREIGRGGMGIVYLAEDTRLQRRVALKALRPSLQAIEKQRARFRREAGMAATLSHPGIATIYALEEWESGQFIVAEYIEGVTLAEEFENGPLTPEGVLDIGMQVSAALAAAHEKAVVHRDIKPQNIIRSTNGRLKVLDFGLAIAHEPDRGVHSRLTDAGALLGTPAFMAPEQLRGEPADYRSDLFALGVVLSTAASGRHPFTGSTVAVTMAAILANEPLSLERLRQSAPRLEAVIRRCLHKDPARRFQSAAELQQTFERIKAAGPEAALEPASPPADGRLGMSWWVGHQIGIIAACVLLTAALWQISEWAPDGITRAAFIGGLAVASVIVTLRLHLIFTYRRNRSAIFRELAGVTPWARRADWGFSLLLAIAAVDIAGERRLVAALLLGFAAAYAIVFLFAEPSTRSSVFEDEPPRR